MKKNTLHTFLTYTSLAFLTVATLTSCEDVVDLDVKSGPPQLVVDGWVTNQQTSQTIRLTESAGYFDNSPAKPVLNATVTVTDDKGGVFSFVDLKKDGNYVWKPV
ncbi:MAG TPA: DUF4249 domain-containing protein, partial [Runella sp.]|nr:DUF4249 domain-containing protein [Runella sp.]